MGGLPARSVVVIDGRPRLSCCRERLGVQREVGPDTSIFEAREFIPAEGDDVLPTLKVQYVKTYDAVDNGEYQVSCNKCGGIIEIEVEEG